MCSFSSPWDRVSDGLDKRQVRSRKAYLDVPRPALECGLLGRQLYVGQLHNHLQAVFVDLAVETRGFFVPCGFGTAVKQGTILSRAATKCTRLDDQDVFEVVLLPDLIIVIDGVVIFGAFVVASIMPPWPMAIGQELVVPIVFKLDSVSLVGEHAGQPSTLPHGKRFRDDVLDRSVELFVPCRVKIVDVAFDLAVAVLVDRDVAWQPLVLHGVVSVNGLFATFDSRDKLASAAVR